jgi:hypothetical protein
MGCVVRDHSVAVTGADSGRRLREDAGFSEGSGFEGDEGDRLRSGVFDGEEGDRSRSGVFVGDDGIRSRGLSGGGKVEAMRPAGVGDGVWIGIACRTASPMRF